MNPSMLRLVLALILISSPMWKNATGFAYSQTEYGSVQNPKEKQIESIRLEEIRAVKTALALRSPENRKAELYMRLAELYLESYRADFLLEGRLQEKALQKNQNATLVRGRSIDDLKNGIGAAEAILTFNVESAKLDKVYYFLGYNYGELGQSEKSLGYYKKLAADYPDSVYAGEGLKAAGDEAFTHGQFDEARVQYEKALKKADDPSQQARLYHKLAWCYYRGKRTDQAIDSMKKAISIAKGNGEKLLNVKEEGLRDIAIYYAGTNRVDEAIDYFKDNAATPDKLVQALEKLGKEYERTGQTDNAKKVYGVLLEMDKKDESSFRVAAHLIDLELLKQNFQAAYERLKALPIPKSTDPETQLAVANLRKQVRSTGVNVHERYRKTENKDEAKKFLFAADMFYSVYLSKFLPQDAATKAERNEIRMYLAEVKHDRGDPEAAADLYKQIIQDKDPKYAKEAAQLWVGSLAAELKKKSSDGDKPGSSPSQLEQDFVAASDLLEQAIPNSVESREARLRTAQILAAYPSQKNEAIRRAAKLAQDAPSTPQGVLAARLWLHLDPNKTTLAKIQANPSLMEADKGQKGELGQSVDAVSKDIRVGEIAGFEKNKNYAEAAKGYEEFAQKAKNEKDADNAYMGALNAYAQGGNSEEVARVMREWKTKYPKSAVVEKTVKNQATQFFIRGLFNDSAELFLGIGRQFKDLGSYLTSAALFDGGLQKQKARDVYKMALALAPNDDRRAEIYKLSAMVANDMKDDLNAFNDWKSCYALKTALKAECGGQIGNYYLRLSDLRQGKIMFELILKIKSGPAAQSPYIAYAQFRLAQILEKEMKNAPLQFPEEQFVKGFQERFAELKPVTDAYQKAIELGGPWGIAATERLGDLSLAFSDEVEKSFKDPKASAALKDTLTAVVVKLRKQALDNSKTAYAMAKKKEILSPALPVIQDRLVEAGIGSMGRAQGMRLGVKLIGIAPDGGKEGIEAAFKRIREHLLQAQDDALGWIDYGNLLWGSGKPGLSKVAYQRSLDLKTRTADAMNNLAVVLVSDQGFENWFAANEAVAIWKKALAQEPNNTAALFNLGHYFNYFRLFELALPYFQRAGQKISIGELHDGLAVAEYGSGQKAESVMEFKKAEEMGEKSDRFTKKYVDAGATEVKADCMKRLNEIPNGKDLKGFERISYERLVARCQ